MNKRSLHDTVFSIQGINPGFTIRDESNNNPPQTTPGKVVLKRFVDYLFNRHKKNKNMFIFSSLIENNF